MPRLPALLAGLALMLAGGMYLSGNDLGSPPPLEPLPLVGDSTVVYDAEAAESAGEAAMRLIDYDWEESLEGWQIHFVDGQGRVSGYTWSQEHLIEIFVKSDSTPESLARVLAHELGHAMDVTNVSPDERLSWLQARGAEGTDWWPVSGAPDFETGAGDFAECFAYMVVDELVFRSKVGPEPDRSQLELLGVIASP